MLQSASFHTEQLYLGLTTIPEVPDDIYSYKLEDALSALSDGESSGRSTPTPDSNHGYR